MMKRELAAICGLIVSLGVILGGCGKNDPEIQPSATEGQSDADLSGEVSADGAGTQEGERATSEVTELTVQFGDAGETFAMELEENSTAAAIANYVGTTEWRLPIYSYDESDAMQYYDIPSRYEIPSNAETVTQAHAGDVYYSDPNRIVLYYHDAEIDEEYTLIGTFDATEEFITAVEENPVLEGWGNKIVVISDGR